MRVSTNTIQDKGINSILQQQERLLKIQQQVSTGKRIQSPADDPTAAARAIDLNQAAALNKQFSENRNNATANLGLVESVLEGVTKLIQNVQTAAVNVGNATFTDSDRNSVALELRGRFEELMAYANSTDATGQFLFSGFQGSTRPFASTATGVQYNGDQGERLVQVGESRQISTSDSGTDIFERIKNGNGVFATAANSTNTGTGVSDVGTVTTPGSLTGNNYDITFTVAVGITTYAIVNTTLGTAVPPGLPIPYTSGDAINFDGIQFSIKGAPANGDKFTVSPSSNQSIFKTIDDLINTISGTGNGNGIKLTNGLNTALQNLQNDLDHILTVRASVGARLQEIDTLQGVGEDSAIQIQKNISHLEDVDYAEAISNMNQQQLFLEAAQKSFMIVSKLTLFDYL
ncbi:MAG: flagellar hook-associated protein FlgL [Nitrosomonas sp.]|nr:flagellar hook-associated protein FlgL [Nitrosomonas sp.]MDP1950153.1 flagellar hook-associated protein FlgL [Nitrosomonas sp.]